MLANNIHRVNKQYLLAYITQYGFYHSHFYEQVIKATSKHKLYQNDDSRAKLIHSITAEYVA